jgi:hypothetical protein
MKCYKCGTALPSTGTRCPSCGQAIYTVFGAPGASKGRRLDGCLPAELSPRDFRAVPNLAALPRRVDLRADCSPVEDQGQVGSCCANAMVGAMEYLERKKGQPAIDLSRLFVYFNARRTGGRADSDAGATIPEGMASFLAFGAPPETAWPYDPDTVTRTPDAAAYKEAISHQPAEYARVDGLDAIKGALARQHPVVFAVSLPQRCYEEAGRSGLAPTPTAAELDAVRSVFGTHAMLLVGYDLDDGTMLVRNSWGTTWGDKGYFRMPIDLFEASAAKGAAWILGELESSGAFTVTRPARTAKPVEGGVRDMASKMREQIRGDLTKDIKDAFKDIKDRVTPPRRDR